VHKKASTGVFFFSDIADDEEPCDSLEDKEAQVLQAGRPLLSTQKILLNQPPHPSTAEAMRLALCKTLSKETLSKKIKEVIGKQTSTHPKQLKRLIVRRSQERKSSLLNTQKLKPSFGVPPPPLKKTEAHQRHNSENHNELFRPVLFQKAQQMGLQEKKLRVLKQEGERVLLHKIRKC